MALINKSGRTIPAGTFIWFSDGISLDDLFGGNYAIFATPTGGFEIRMDIEEEIKVSIPISVAQACVNNVASIPLHPSAWNQMSSLIKRSLEFHNAESFASKVLGRS